MKMKSKNEYIFIYDSSTIANTSYTLGLWGLAISLIFRNTTIAYNHILAVYSK